MTEQNPAAEEQQTEHRRTIKSFVMRAGRMTEGQQRGLEQGWPKYGLELADGLRDFDEVFGRSAPRTFEIGFGMGHSTLEMAAAAPEQDFIGVEVHKPGVGALLSGLVSQKLTNVRVYSCDALEVLRDCVADASLDRVLLFFPDPWHKSRHHKRRIVQPAFAELVRRKLKVGGVLHMATDWEPYAEHMLEVMNVAPGYRNLAQDGRCVPRPTERPVTVRTPRRAARPWRLGPEVPAHRLSEARQATPETPRRRLACLPAYAIARRIHRRAATAAREECLPGRHACPYQTTNAMPSAGHGHALRRA